VPVEVVKAQRQPIAQYFETQGTLEAEQEVDLVARMAGPIVEMKTEEGQRVRQGDLLARMDDRELQAQLKVSQVRLDETRQSYERSKALLASGLTSQETVDQALANYQSAQGDLERLKVQVQYAEIRAPFSGLVVERYVKFAQHVTNNERLFRLSDFDPLLCPIQVPEKELPRLRPGQPAKLQVESWPDESFAARVLRVSPVVDAESGTVKVTLEVAGQGKLRPGMFASAYLEMESKPAALVIPKQALALDSLEDTVFVARDGVAERRTLRLGFRSQDLLEVLEGLSEGESVVVVGQDGLSAGTPVEIRAGRTATAEGGQTLAGGETAGAAGAATSAATGAAPASAEGSPRGRGGRPQGMGGGPPGGLDPAKMTPEQLEGIKERMRSRGLSDKEIEQRLKRMREGAGSGG
jgi:RND family efflux transporter MFP subunit